MTDELMILAVTAASIGFGHTVLGPDHYVPFIAMAAARRWSLLRTLVITTLCGLGHVLSSVVLGALGIAFGWAVAHLEWFEGARGGLAGWLLLGFGLAYTAWGIRRAVRNRPHRHGHVHADGTLHDHAHTHHDEHVHVHAAAGDEVAPVRQLTPWILMTIFVFGPCEPLIPVLMYPAAQGSGWGVVLVATVFSVATIGTMLAAVTIGHLGVTRLPLARLERYSHALAGLALVACGVFIQMGF